MESINTITRTFFGAGLAILLGLAITDSDQALAQTPNCVAPPAGLVGWWPLDGTGDDIVGGNDGVVTGTASFVAGEVDDALSVAGNNSSLQIADDPSLDFGIGDLSIDAWIKTSANFGIKTILDKRDLSRLGDPDDRGYVLYLDNGRLAFQLANGPFTNYVSSTNVADGAFHHVAVTVDRDLSTGGKLYVDGAVVLTFNPTPRNGSLDNASDLFIGKRVDNLSGASFNGLIDEVELSDLVLTEAEMQAIFDAGTAGKCKREDVTIDIKPGSYPNSINLSSGGATPVAILGSLDLDVSEIDTESLTIGTAGVRTVGKKDHQLCSIEDVSGDFTFGLEGLPDGFDDLVCHFVTIEIVPEAGDTNATLSGNLLPEFGGGAIQGQDSVNIVP